MNSSGKIIGEPFRASSLFLQYRTSELVLHFSTNSSSAGICSSSFATLASFLGSFPRSISHFLSFTPDALFPSALFFLWGMLCLSPKYISYLRFLLTQIDKCYFLLSTGNKHSQNPVFFLLTPFFTPKMPFCHSAQIRSPILTLVSDSHSHFPFGRSLHYSSSCSASSLHFLPAVYALPSSYSVG